LAVISNLTDSDVEVMSAMPEGGYQIMEKKKSDSGEFFFSFLFRYWKRSDSN